MDKANKELELALKILDLQYANWLKNKLKKDG